MRAKYALALAALSAVTFLAPINRAIASDLTCDVAKILNRGGLFPQHIFRRTRRAAVIAPAACGAPAVLAAPACGTSVLTSPAVIAAPIARPALLEDKNGTPMIRSLPVVIAPSTCGAALLSPIPRDLDERRDALEKRINEATALGQLDACASGDLKAAMSEIKQAELNWLALGPLSNEMSRRLYNSMDKVDSDLHWYVNPNSVRLLGVRIIPNSLWY